MKSLLVKGFDMKIFDEIENIDDKIKSYEDEKNIELLLENGSIPQNAQAFGSSAMGAPWLQHTQQSAYRDTDGDGIPDALDNHFGAGANDPFEQ